MWRDYWELTKPRVVLLMLLTAWVGMLLACPPGYFPATTLLLATLGIACCAGCAAVVNHVVDRSIDKHMLRTQTRPVASGRVSPMQAMLFSLLLGATGLSILILYVNSVTAWLSLVTLLGYALFYTLFLKRATPQNIVIGGAAGAAPPLLGWSSISADISPFGLLLVLIIFTWTPPHFWALAIYRHEEYKQAKIPMLPVTHGIPFTKLCIILYTLLMIAATALPFVTHMSGSTYLLAALGLGAGFLYYAVRLYFSDNPKLAMALFRYSIVYLMGLFSALLLDHYLVLFLH